MIFDAYIVLAVIIFIFISLYFDIIGPVFTFIIGMIILGLFGVLTPSEIIHGFANEQLLVILMLLMIGEFVRGTSFFERIFVSIFSKKRTYRGFLSRIFLITAGFSAFLNNTPLVAVMMPHINKWSKMNNISKSKLLIPLSYAAIIGGCVTLIGTSTHLLTNGLISEQNIIPEFTRIGLFDFAYIGLPMLLVGFLYVILFSFKLLPKRVDYVDEFDQNTREYVIQTKIRSGSSLIGKSISEAGLRNLKGLFLAEIIRNNKPIIPVGPYTLLEKNDELIFVGDTSTIAEMINMENGLEIEQSAMYPKSNNLKLSEVVISNNSPLVNKTIKESNFRSKFDAVILSVFRNGERVSGKLGVQQIKAGDVLLILAGSDFDKLSNNGHNFYPINTIKELRYLKPYEVLIVFGSLIGAIVLSGLGVLSLFMGLIVVLSILISFKIAKAKDIPKYIDYNLAIIIALSLALGTAITKTGVAEIFATNTINLFKPFGIWGILSALFIVTSLIGSFISNKAAIAIMLPITLLIAKSLSINPLPLSVLVSQAAAASFMTPIGYQTNLMVYGPGSYKYKDFIKIGTPLTILYGIASVFIVYYFML